MSHRYSNIVAGGDYYPFGLAMEDRQISREPYKYGYQGQFAEKDEETGLNHFELREYDPLIGRWTTMDLADQYPSPYVGMGNDPVNGVDPDGAWKPDANGNLVAEAGDNVVTLMDYTNKSYEEVSGLFNNLRNWNSADAIESVEGHTLTMDNVYTRSIANANANVSFEGADNYNCWGAAIHGTSGEELGQFTGIFYPSDFDRTLVSDFKSVTSDKMIFGQSIIRFSTNAPYASSDENTLVSMGLKSRDPRKIGGSLHGAVFYGKDHGGTIYVYTKNGWRARPKVMKFTDLMNGFSDYGSPVGIGRGTGYYNPK